MAELTIGVGDGIRSAHMVRVAGKVAAGRANDLPPSTDRHVIPIILRLGMAGAAAGHKSVTGGREPIRTVKMAGDTIGLTVIHAAAVVRPARVIVHGIARVIRIHMTGHTNSAGCGADTIIKRVDARHYGKDHRAGRDTSTGIYAHIIADRENVILIPMRVVALSA